MNIQISNLLDKHMDRKRSSGRHTLWLPWILGMSFKMILITDKQKRYLRTNNVLEYHRSDNIIFRFVLLYKLCL